MPQINITLPAKHTAAETGSLNQLRPDIITIHERFDIDSMLAMTHNSNSTERLIDAREALLVQVREALNDSGLKDWNVIKRWNEVLTNFDRRIIAERVYQLTADPIYQPVIKLTNEQERLPAWKDMTKTPAERDRLRRGRQRNRKCEHSDAKQILYHKLKSSGREDFEYLRRLKAVEAGIRSERQQMQATLEMLNTRPANRDDHNNTGSEVPVSSDLTMDDLISRELSARGGKPKRLPREKLCRSGTQGMLKLLREKTDRYPIDDERILPWDIPVKRISWWKRASTSVLKSKRPSCAASSESIASIPSSISSEESEVTKESSLEAFPAPPTGGLMGRVKLSKSKWRLFPIMRSSVSSMESEELPGGRSLDAFPFPPTSRPTERVKLSVSKRMLLVGVSLRAQVKVPRRLRAITGRK